MTPRGPRILFLNQYFPPDPAPTGALFKDIANDLATHGFQCTFVGASQDYRDHLKTRSRTLRELFALGSILIKGLCEPKVGLVVSGSSPPCLAVVAALVARFHRVKSLHWAMDLYPELAVALGELKPGFLSKALRKGMYIAYQNAQTVVAMDEDMAKRFEAYGVTPKIIRPWPPASMDSIPRRPSDASADSTWIYSGNLGRAHEWKTLLEAQALLEKRGSAMRLIFQGGGSSWLPARERANRLGLSRCDWLPYIAETELRSRLSKASAIIVTQKSETQGLLWPSKLALALDLERPILWIGPQGAVSNLLRQSPGTGVFEPGDSVGIANWLETLPSQPTGKICDATAHRQQAIADWRELISESA